MNVRGICDIRKDLTTVIVFPYETFNCAQYFTSKF